MTAAGDMCSCGDIALPGQELCAGCFADWQQRHDETGREAAWLTEQHEQIVTSQETAA